MKFSSALVGLSLLGRASTFAPPQPNFATDASRAGSFAATPLVAAPSDEGESPLIPMPTKVASVVAAAVISASTLGLSVTPPPPAFAAVKTETVAPKKVPAEVAAVNTAKSQVVAAAQSIAQTKEALAVAQASERSLSRDYNNVAKQIDSLQVNVDVASTRLKTLKSNPKPDAKAVAASEARVAETSTSLKNARAKVAALKTASEKANKEVADKRTALDRAAQGKESAQGKVKLAEEKLKQYEKKQAEVQKQAEKVAREKAQVEAKKQKEKADAAKKKTAEQAKKQKEKETAAKKAAAKDAKKQKEKDVAAKKKAAKQAKKDAEKAKKAAEKAKKKAAEQAKKDAEKAKKAAEQAKTKAAEQAEKAQKA